MKKISSSAFRRSLSHEAETSQQPTDSHKPAVDTASERLAHGIEMILQRWEVLVRQQFPMAKEFDSSTLRNSLGEFLRELAKIISPLNDPKSVENIFKNVIAVAKSHGMQRADERAYALSQVIYEYQLLRKVTFESLEKEKPLTVHERERLLEAFDNGVVQASTEFAERRGFQAARLSAVEAQFRDARGELKVAKHRVDELQVERALRERFVSALTHDLRTPLSAIKASAELIVKQAEKTDLVRKLALRIDEGSNRIDRMIRDMLDANRIEAGEPVTLRFEECDLGPLVKDLIDNLSTIHGDRFSLKMNGDLMGNWSCDALQRVIENLVGNGIKYGSPTEKVGIILTGLPNSVTISVRNQGKPIPEEQQAMLFQPYKRLLSAQIGGHVGWGLGLILCKGIVEAHGGKIEVISDAESGTVFTATLPRDSR